MPDYLLLMHDDASSEEQPSDWAHYLAVLRGAGRFQGGSAIGSGICARKAGPPRAITSQISGYIRVMADDFDDARKLLAGNPAFEAGGAIELRELPKTD